LPVIILLAPVFLITMIPDHSRPIPTPLGWLSLILGIAAFPYAIVKYLDAGALAETLAGDIGFGARLLIFGTFVTIVGIGVGLARNLLRLPSGGTYPARRPAPDRKAPSQESPRRQATQRQTPRPRPPQAGKGVAGSASSGTDPATPRPRTGTTPPGRAAQQTRPSRPADPGER
jgi:predicted lipid-binding transport protein (Tim44 family)